MERQVEDTVKIKSIYEGLEPSLKDDVRKRISDKFGITLDTAKNHWLYGGNIPKSNVKVVLAIVKRAGAKQIEKMQSLVN